MGPPGLLPKLRCMLQHEFAWMDRCSGATVGVDAFKLLHEAVRNHCDQCVLSGNHSGALGYIIQKMDTMRCNGIRPLMVFDGRDLDGKAVAGRKRRKDRLQAQDAVAVALSDQDADALADGTLTVQVDPKTLQAAAAVTTGFVGLCVDACREMGISYVVAPNEADAQLAYLARTGQVQYVITDDGDLCVYGCPRVLLKVDFSTGKCDLFEASRLLISTPGTQDSPLLKLCRKWGTDENPCAVLASIVSIAGQDYDKFEGWGLGRAIEVVGKVPKQMGCSQPPTASLVRAMDQVQKKNAALQMPDDAAGRIEAVVAIYTNQFVYNLVAQCDQPLATACRVGLDAAANAALPPAPAMPDVCGVAAPAGAEVDVEILQAGVQTRGGAGVISSRMKLAEAHAFGFVFTERGLPSGAPRPYQQRQLHEVRCVLREGARLPQYLTFDMVGGSTIDKAAVAPEHVINGWKAGMVQKATLALFLKTRGWDKLSTKSWEELASAVHAQLEVEENLLAMAEKNGNDVEIKLRDAEGRCLHQYLVERGVSRTCEFPQYDGELCSPAANAECVTQIGLIQNQAPMLPEKVLLRYYSPLGAEDDDNVRVLRRGFSHIQSLQTIPDLKYYPPGSVPDKPDVAVFSMRSHASFKSHDYMVTAWVRVDLHHTAKIKPITEVLKIRCAPTKVCSLVLYIFSLLLVCIVSLFQYL